MKTLTATYRIVTPMFIGDADQKASSLRPPSVKGALRYWWRALHWGECLRAEGNDVNAALRHLHEKERRLFGWMAVTAEENKQVKQIGGQGQFLLRVSRQPAMTIVKDWPKNSAGSNYLGFGILESGNPEKDNYQPHREGIKENTDFDLQLCFKPGCDESDIESIKQVLRVWGLVGGLGSRSRRGFGSVMLTALDGENCLYDQAGYEVALRDLVKQGAAVPDFPPFTAFSAHADFGVLDIGKKARNVHDQAGQSYKEYRLQKKNEENGKIPFGLPLQIKGIDREKRRASPLFFHIHQLQDDTFIAVVLYLPAEFHHDPKIYKSDDLETFYQHVAGFVPKQGASA